MNTDEFVDEFLSHHGVKGMKWGVRKQRNSSDSQSIAPSDHKKLKTAAVILGSAAGIALIAAGTYYVAKNGNLPVSLFSTVEKATGKRTLEEVVKPSEHELTRIIHVAGVKHHPDATFRTGGHPDVYSEMLKANLANEFGSTNDNTAFKRYGSNLEKVGVKFPDPLGRKDAVGRPVHHSIILPQQHTSDITNFEQAKAKAWDLTHEDYQKFWDFGSNSNYTPKEARRLGIID